MIKISNIYWMLAYANQTLNQIEYKRLETEEFDNIYDLFCEIMIIGVSKQLKKGIDRQYVLKKENIKSIKGKILFQESVKKCSMKNYEMYCEFDEYSQNSYMNQILKTAIIALIQSNKMTEKARKNDLKKIMLYFNDISTLDKNTIKWGSLTYNRNNKSYRFLMNVSYLILNGLIAKDEEGNTEFLEFLEEKIMYKIYESFILEYYKYHYPELTPGAPIVDWNIKESNIMSSHLPQMKSDIVLKYNEKTLMIDAKYYSKIFQQRYVYSKEKFKSNNMYQIYTYVKNYDKQRTGNVSGMLLYANTDEEYNFYDSNNNIEPINIDGNKFIITTLDLDKTFLVVAEQLDNIANWLSNDKIKKSNI